MDQIKTFEEACAKLGIDPEKVLPETSAYPFPHQKALTAIAKLFIIADALNEGWKPNWNDDEYKWYAWFDMENGFSFYDAHWYYTVSVVGSRLCYRSREIAEYAGKQFIDLYKDFMVL